MKIFHALTGAPDNVDSSFIEEILEKSMVLLPPEQRSNFTTTGLLDQMAGDGQYVFLSPIRPLNNFVTIRKPCFMFDAARMWQQYRPVFRIYDLAGDYSQASESGKTYQKIRNEEESLPFRSAELELVAKAATQSDTYKAKFLLQEIEHTSGNISSLVPDQISISEIENVVEQCALPKKRDVFKRNLQSVLHRIYGRWQRPSIESEILIHAKVRLNDAEAWSTDLKNWHAIRK